MAQNGCARGFGAVCQRFGEAPVLDIDKSHPRTSSKWGWHLAAQVLWLVDGGIMGSYGEKEGQRAIQFALHGYANREAW